MRVVVFEPNPTGHHFAYLGHAMPALAELPCEPILLTTASAADSQQFAQHLGPFATRFHVDRSGAKLKRGASIRAAWRQLSALKQSLRQLKPDHFYLPYGDDLVQVVGLANLLGDRPWSSETLAEVLLLRGGYQYPAYSWGKRLRLAVTPSLICRGPWERIHHLNPDDLEVIKRTNSSPASKFRLMPDPTEPPPQISAREARRQLGLPEEGRWLGCAGMMDRRKGIDLLVYAWQASARRRLESDRLLLAGPMALDIKHLVEQQLANELHAGQVMIIDRQLTTDEINLAILALDVVCTPYPNHSASASIVIRAAAANRLVLGSALGWMKRTIQQFGLGTTCNVLDADVLARAIPASLEASGGFVLSEAGRRFVKFHEPQNFTAHWTARLRERIGLPADDAMIPWDWVLAALPNPSPR